MHQVLLQWIGDQVEIVPADTTVHVAAADLDPWQIEGTDCLSGRAWDGQYLNVTDQGVEIVGEDLDSFSQ